MRDIPKHLLRYTRKQDYSLYTHEDQAVWRFIMRQLFSFLKEHAHPAYVDGLDKTGISIERIPNISEMDAKLSAYGWRAVPVSGFIPPAAFMSFQAHGILPIACEMRSIDHILYTPAPDIVHEAAGHAPILIDRDFTNYLTAYAEVAQKAIISCEDIALYEAIRDLSDIKESPNSIPEEIAQAEKHLNETASSMTYVSEAQLLGRMNWWTAEYGLIGDLENPKIFGAGLLSSIGEARNSLTKPKHIEFDIGCLDYSYDITEQQPQLFVAKDFNSLTKSLKEMSLGMAFSQGGVDGLAKAKRAKSVCTVCIENGDTYSGIIDDYSVDESGKLTELKILAPCLVNDSKLYDENQTFSFTNPVQVSSVHGGPSSFEAYPEFEDFASKAISKNPVKDPKTEELLKDIRITREDPSSTSEDHQNLIERYFDGSSHHWLAGLEILELEASDKIKNHLLKLKSESKKEDVKTCIDLGLSLIL